MNYTQILEIASSKIANLTGRTLDVLELSKPKSTQSACQLAKVVSKLSPLLGNMIEYTVVDILNELKWDNLGQWVRQDPGFPDATFIGDITPAPGIEIKTWFPFATEITARFKDSVLHFANNQINVALIAWLPENIIFGKPIIIDSLICSAYSVANARDLHYHNPPHYLVFEPEDTSARTCNLQQTNTNGYVFQGDNKEYEEIKCLIDTWDNGFNYSTSPEYQRKIKSLIGRYNYRLDTNFAKIDRIQHSEIEVFKKRVLNTIFKGKTIRDWAKILSRSNEQELEKELLPIIL